MVKIKRLPQYPGYGVSKDGQVWSRWHLVGKNHYSAVMGKWRRMCNTPGDQGYINCWIKYLNRSIGAHVLVALAFIGEIPKGYHVNHIDGVKHHNNWDNLEVVTPLGNIQHAWNHNLIQVAKPKLTESQVREIRMRVSNGEKQSKVAKDFGIDPTGVSDIVLRTTWKHIE